MAVAAGRSMFLVGERGRRACRFEGRLGLQSWTSSAGRHVDPFCCTLTNASPMAVPGDCGSGRPDNSRSAPTPSLTTERGRSSAGAEEPSEAA